MKKLKFIDTNIIIESPEIILSGDCVITSIGFSELESIKSSGTKGEEVKYKARKAIRFLNEHTDKFEIFVVDNDIYDIVTSKNLPHSNDNLISACAYKLEQDGNDVVFISNDSCARFIAQSYFGMNVDTYRSTDDIKSYKGYKEVFLTEGEMAYFYEHPADNKFDCLQNEYIIIKNIENETIDKLKWDGVRYIPLKLGKIKDFKPLNIQQELAFDLMASDTPIKILLGNAGSGKTLINMKFGLNAVQKGKFSRILYLREICGKGSNIGFLPGTKIEKMMPFLQGVVDNLDMGEFELQKMIQEGTMAVDSPYFLKGSSKSDTWFLVDEAEDLDTEMIKLIGTRISKGSCICLSGDLNQTEGKYKSNNGLESFVKKFKGNELVGIVKLKEDMRSEASKLFNTL